MLYVSPSLMDIFFGKNLASEVAASPNGRSPLRQAVVTPLPSYMCDSSLTAMQERVAGSGMTGQVIIAAKNNAGYSLIMCLNTSCVNTHGALMLLL